MGWSLLVLCSAGCTTGTLRGEVDIVPSRAQAPEALAALQASRFEEAERLALQALAAEDRNAQAHLVAGLTRYKRAMHQLVSDLIGVGAAYFAQGLNQQYLDFTLAQAEAELLAVDQHLALAARDPDVALELCLACWEVDWNRSGEVDERDRRLGEVELDAQGQELPDGDPRRRPTFRFDVGDAHWARAMLAFQRALLQVVSAYQAPERAALMGSLEGRGQARVVVKLRDPAAVLRARELVLLGLAEAERCRLAYLAERDDDREWVPNPRQRSYALPLPVDEALYQTWAGVLGDLTRLLEGEEGLGVTDVAQLGDHVWRDPPRGYVNVRRMFEAPGDVVLDAGNLERLDRDQTRETAEAVLRDVLGDKYVPEMKASPLPSRLARMKTEVERGEESLEKKLRYLFWLN
ncbi:MAG TPA: hypothetical protein P5076_00725 [Myxococcota bacterium]|nr:hypothetical protein [Myxococcota bacterium]